MEILGSLHQLLAGFAVATTPENLFYCLAGAIVGTLVGILPGLGPIAGIALLIPATFSLSPTSAIIMLAGIYYGAMYGGSTTSILINVPGETASVMTCIEGYQMARKGRAGPALAICAIGSFIAGGLAILGLAFLAPPLAEAALAFGPPEFFSLMVFGFVVLSNVTGGSLLKSLMMAVVGLIIGTIGLDPVTGDQRFTFGSVSLLGGIEFVAVAIGLFGIAEVLVNVEQPADALEQGVLVPRFRDLYPTLSDIKQSLGAILRGTGIGFGVGLVPGPAPVIATYASYMVEKSVARHPEEFGHGAIQGVAGPESANNAACQSAFIPLFVLGIPFAPPTAILLGALLIHGVNPGPTLISEHPQLFWGVVASMYIGNFILLLLNLPFVPLFANILRVPKKVLLPLVMLFCLTGMYSVNNFMVDLWVMLACGALGYLMRKWAYEGAPLLLALVLGPRMEVAFRQSLMISHGDFAIFLARPVSLGFLLATLGFLLLPLLKRGVQSFTRRAPAAR
ncbi:MAG TPA: tripartite tricarboxylate transporter permease [Candidatus Methylomirabilis sp.]|nr:tripartite tricarboxylate transporter permease [Candidatus Methylomirabilis sp.]HSB77694.1 tripartite tricarboxylate transporter permease [Candidatus Methylomirabilis sp.]